MIGSLNAPSLLKHKDEIKTILNDYKIDILALNETKLNNLIDDNLVSIGGYSLSVMIEADMVEV